MQEMRILKLTIKKKWFDMILSGEKKTEYREVKWYWTNRLMEFDESDYKNYNAIQFFNGAYFSESLPNFTIKLNGIYIGEGVEEWGAKKNEKYFCLELGNVIKSTQINLF
jgi:hypothetical protein